MAIFGTFRGPRGGQFCTLLHNFKGGLAKLPSQKHPPPLPADLPLEQDMVETPGLEQYRGYSSGGPVTLIIRVLLHPPGGVLLGLFLELILDPPP